MYGLRSVLCSVWVILIVVHCPAFAEDDKVDEILQELFLGETAYPQDRHELQFSTGFFRGLENEDNVRLPVLFEYGVSDHIQIGVEFPIDFNRMGGEDAEGVGNIELEVYYNFRNDLCTGWAAGFGLGLGLPSVTTDVGEEAVIYEPFFVLYRDLDTVFFNFSAGLEIEDPTEFGEETQVNGQLAVAVFRTYEPFVIILEAAVDIETDRTLSRLAPGMYWQSPGRHWEVGISLPIGLNSDTPDIGVFALFTIEFGGNNDD